MHSRTTATHLTTIQKNKNDDTSTLTTTAHLEGKQIREALEPRHSPVDVVAEEQKLSGRQVHPQLPDVVREEIQVLLQ